METKSPRSTSGVSILPCEMPWHEPLVTIDIPANVFSMRALGLDSKQKEQANWVIPGTPAELMRMRTEDLAQLASLDAQVNYDLYCSNRRRYQKRIHSYQRWLDMSRIILCHRLGMEAQQTSV